MRLIIPSLLFILQLGYISPNTWAESPLTGETDFIEVRQRLQEYEGGKKTLEEITGPEWCQKLLIYYLSHTNEVTTKMKLPISRCFAALARFPEAADLATDYINVYSNDWRGWDILGGAKLMTKSYNEALAAMTNAVRLGDERNWTTLGAAALATERLDILRTMVVPRLLVLKDAKETPKKKRLEMIIILLSYALNADQTDVFTSALEGLDVNDILSRDDLKFLVKQGCEHFKTKETEKLCNKIEETK